MKIFYDICESLIGESLAERFLTIGNFDGVHLGHQRLLNRLKDLRSGPPLQGPKDVRLAALTFDPHPNEVLLPDKPHFRLFDRVDLAEQMQLCGIQDLFVLPFTDALARLSPKEFFDQVLMPLNPRCIVVGSDFRFGSQRAGDTQLLNQLLQPSGGQLFVEQKLCFEGEPISSTRLRELLEAGDVKQVELLLGRPYEAKGVVVEGDKRGRTLGFPTANLWPQHQPFILKSGVYATDFLVEETGERFHSVTNVGRKPTFISQGGVNLETHCMGFSGNIYGKSVRIRFKSFLRDEVAFESAEALKAQIQKDIHRAQQFFE